MSVKENDSRMTKMRLMLCLVGRMENNGVDSLPLLFPFPREGKPYFPSECLVGQIWEGGFLIFPRLVGRIRRWIIGWIPVILPFYPFILKLYKIFILIKLFKNK